MLNRPVLHIIRHHLQQQQQQQQVATVAAAAVTAITATELATTIKIMHSIRCQSHSIR